MEIHDAIFGHLKSDEDFSFYFRATLPFSDSETVEFTLNFETNPQVLCESCSDELGVIMKRAHEIYTLLKSHDRSVRRNLALHHLDLEYDWWNTDEKPVDVEAFVSAMMLYGVSIIAGVDEISSRYAMQLDYHVRYPFGFHYLYAATNALIEITDTEFRM